MTQSKDSSRVWMSCSVERAGQRLKTNDQRLLLSRDGRALRCLAAVVAQRHIHEDISTGRIATHHQSFGVFRAFAPLFGGVQGWRMNVKVKSLVVERSDGVANDLVRQLTDRLRSEEHTSELQSLRHLVC